MSIRVSLDDFETEVLKFKKIAIADFYSDSCIPCKRMSPVLSEIENEFGEDVKLAKININFDSQLAENYEVQSVPTLILFKDGKETARLTGVVKKADIEELINNIN